MTALLEYHDSENGGLSRDTNKNRWGITLISNLPLDTATRMAQARIHASGE